jgi:hypothetical protein
MKVAKRIVSKSEKNPAAELFPDLGIVIHDRNGMRIERLADPRRAFAEAYQRADPAAKCYPVSLATFFASDSRREV